MCAPMVHDQHGTIIGEALGRRAFGAGVNGQPLRILALDMLMLRLPFGDHGLLR